MQSIIFQNQMFRGLFLEETPYAAILVTDHPTSRKRPLSLGILGGGRLRDWGSTIRTQTLWYDYF